MSLPCIPYDIICNPYNFFCYEGRCVQNVVKVVCLTHRFWRCDIPHISNVNDVLQYPRITALYNIPGKCNFPGCKKKIIYRTNYASSNLYSDRS